MASSPESISCYVVLSRPRDTTVNSKDKPFLQQATHNSLTLTRPKTTITKTYRCDAILQFGANSKNDEDSNSTIRISIALQYFSLGNDVLLWTFGTRQTGKSTILFENDDGIIQQITSKLPQLLKNEEALDGVSNTLTISYLCITGDETDRIVDCLSPSTKDGMSFLSRIRENNESGLFYMDETTNVICKNEDEMNLVLKKARENFNAASSLCQRRHCLITFTLYKTYLDNGDVVSSQFQIMDLCGVTRDNDVLKQKGTVRRGAIKREDKTLKAINRIIDKLSEMNDSMSKKGKKVHVPYRDSKLTRLVKNGFSEPTSSHNIAVVGVSTQNYDECSAMLEKMAKIKSIQENYRAMKSETSPMIRRTNRLRQLEELKNQAKAMGETLGMSNVADLKSDDIKLDMNSAMTLVELRDVIARIERLEIDPMIGIYAISDIWWREHSA